MSKRNQRQFHNRLYLGEFVKSFIGPSRRIKCVKDEGGSRYFRYASLLLENLDVEHPVYQYIISVSQEFRKRFCAAASDDLLFYIHSWSKLAVHLQEMGIPLEVTARDMRVIINECIEHIDSGKMNISECREKLNKHNVSCCSEKDIKVGVQSDSILNEKELSKQGIEDIFTDKSKDDDDFEYETEILDESHVDTYAKDDSCLGQNIKGIVQENSKYDITNKIISSSCESEGTANVNEDGIEYFHLEMKNIDQDEDCDDISWFFDDIEGDEERDKEKVSNVIALNEGSEDFGNKIDAPVNKDYNTYGDENSDDSGAIITDLENLKRDIENDIKRFKNSKERVVKEKIHEATVCLNNDHTFNDEFDSCFNDDSDSEFDVCFEKHENSVNKTIGYNEDYYKTSTDSEEVDEFKTVALEFINKNIGRNLLKEKAISSQSRIFNRLKEKCLDSEVNETKAFKGSFDIELQSCNKEYSRVKEMIEESSVNCEMVKEKDKLSVVTLIPSSCNTEADRYKYETQNDDNDSFCSSHSKNLQTKTQGNSMFQREEIQRIDSMLGILGREHQKDSNKIKVSSLKFCSRHFQGEENEELDEMNSFKDEESTGHSGNDVNGKNISISNAGTNSFSSNNSIIYQSFVSGSDMVCNNLPPPYLSSEQHVDEKQTLKNINLETVDRMLREINDITKQNNGCDGSSQETIVPDPVGKKDKDLRFTLKSNEINICKSNGRSIVRNCAKSELDISSLEKCLPLKESKTGGVNQPGVFLRSRHMNIDSDFSENSNDCGTYEAFHKQQNQKTEIIEAKKVPNIKMSATGQSVHAHGEDSEELEIEVTSLVFGVNYDGDEGLNKAVCDVVLKQSTEGKLRLNTDFVDCHSIIGIGRSAQDVINGVVVQTSVGKMMMMQKFPQRLYRALLVNGDLTMSFKHKGYKPMKVAQFTSVESFEHGKTKLQCWLDDIINTLKELCVDMLLVKGNISEELVCVCEQLSIITVETVRYKQLIQLSEATETDMVTYVTIATEDNVCTGVSVAPLLSNWCDKVGSSWKNKVDTVISVTENNPQTVILHGASPECIDLKEQEFWNCLQHISSVLHYGALVEGAGQTEEKCQKFLKEKLDILKRDKTLVTDLDAQFMQLVTESVMSSFQEYSRLFQDRGTAGGCIFEGYKSKIETLKLALETVAIVTNIDIYIETGITDEEADTGTL